jgi:hypothetical protein
MWTQCQSIPSDGSARQHRSWRSLAIHAAIISSMLGLSVPPPTASSQTLDGPVRAVQPHDVRKAERHQSGQNNDAAATAVLQTVEQPRRVEPHSSVISPTVRIRSKAMNRTARAHLQNHRQGIGLPPTAMICQDCEPEHPTCPPRLYNCPPPQQW